MTICHHPDDLLLADYAAGMTDHGRHVAIATHLLACPHCRAFVRSIEQVGGGAIIDMPPTPMRKSAFQEVEERFTAPVSASSREKVVDHDAELSGLPTFVKQYRFGKWTWIAPSVSLRPINLPHPSDMRVFILKSGPGTKMLQHSHTGLEMTCVLSGAFRQGDDIFGPGDFDLGDDKTEHQPIVEQGADCVCLVALSGELRMKGLMGRLVQPFLRL